MTKASTIITNSITVLTILRGWRKNAFEPIHLIFEPKIITYVIKVSSYLTFIIDSMLIISKHIISTLP